MDCGYLLGWTNVVFDFPPAVQFFLLFFGVLVVFLAAPRAIVFFYCTQHHRRAQSSSHNEINSGPSDDKTSPSNVHLSNDGDSSDSVLKLAGISGIPREESCGRLERVIRTHDFEVKDDNTEVLSRKESHRVCREIVDNLLVFEVDSSAIQSKESQLVLREIVDNHLKSVDESQDIQSQCKDINDNCTVNDYECKQGSVDSSLEDRSQTIDEEELEPTVHEIMTKNCECPQEFAISYLANLMKHQMALIQTVELDVRELKIVEDVGDLCREIDVSDFLKADSSKQQTQDIQPLNLCKDINDNCTVNDYECKQDSVDSSLEGRRPNIDEEVTKEELEPTLHELLTPTCECPQEFDISCLTDFMKVQRASIQTVQLDVREMKIVEDVGDLCRAIDVSAFLNADSRQQQTQDMVTQSDEDNKRLEKDNVPPEGRESQSVTKDEDAFAAIVCSKKAGVRRSSGQKISGALSKEIVTVTLTDVEEEISLNASVEYLVRDQTQDSSALGEVSEEVQLEVRDYDSGCLDQQICEIVDNVLLDASNKISGKKTAEADRKHPPQDSRPTVEGDCQVDSTGGCLGVQESASSDDDEVVAEHRAGEDDLTTAAHQLVGKQGSVHAVCALDSQISLEIDLLETRDVFPRGRLDTSSRDLEADGLQEREMCRDILADLHKMVQDQLLRMHTRHAQEDTEHKSPEVRSALETVSKNEDLILSHTLKEMVQDEPNVLDDILDEYSCKEPFVNCLPRFLVSHVDNSSLDREDQRSVTSMETELYCLDSFDAEDEDMYLLQHKDSMEILCTRRSCDHEMNTSLRSLRSSVEILHENAASTSDDKHGGHGLVGPRDSIEVLCLKNRISSEELCTSGRPFDFGGTPPKSILKIKKSSHSRTVSWKDLQEGAGCMDSGTLLISDHHDVDEDSDRVIRVFNGKIKECQSVCDETELSAWLAKDLRHADSLSNLYVDDEKSGTDEDYLDHDKSMKFWMNVNIDKSTNQESWASNKSLDDITTGLIDIEDISSQTKVNEKSKTTVYHVGETPTSSSLDSKKRLPSKSCLKSKRADKTCRSEPAVHKVTVNSHDLLSGSWKPSTVPRCDDDEGLNNLSDKLLEISEKFYAKKFDKDNESEKTEKTSNEQEPSPEEKMSILERYFVTIMTDDETDAEEDKQT